MTQSMKGNIKIIDHSRSGALSKDLTTFLNDQLFDLKWDINVDLSNAHLALDGSNTLEDGRGGEDARKGHGNCGDKLKAEEGRGQWGMKNIEERGFTNTVA